MRGLLDINVLIALVDPDHTFHDRAHAWHGKNRKHGWASSPLTENGMVRILSNPSYNPDRRQTPGEIIAILKEFKSGGAHEFWPDEISLTDSKHFRAAEILGSRQITDIYLLALAVQKNGRLVTFDEGIHLGSVTRARAEHLEVIR